MPFIRTINSVLLNLFLCLGILLERLQSFLFHFFFFKPVYKFALIFKTVGVQVWRGGAEKKRKKSMPIKALSSGAELFFFIGRVVDRREPSVYLSIK